MLEFILLATSFNLATSDYPGEGRAYSYMSQAYIKHQGLDIYYKDVEKKIFNKEQRRALGHIVFIGNVIQTNKISYAWTF